jgi:hypothetical protein
VKKLTSATLPAVIAAAVAWVAFAAAAGTPIKFLGTYSGTAVTKATDDVVDISATGTGKGTLIGAGKLTGVGKGDSSQRPCVPFNGTGSLSGAGGTLAFKVLPSSTGCGDDAGQLFSITAKAQVLKGTKKLAKVKGVLRITGTYDRSSGAFSVKFSGLLTK